MNQKDLKLYVKDLEKSIEFFDKEPKKFDQYDKARIDYTISLGKKAIDMLKIVDNLELNKLIKNVEQFLKVLSVLSVAQMSLARDLRGK